MNAPELYVFSYTNLYISYIAVKSSSFSNVLSLMVLNWNMLKANLKGWIRSVLTYQANIRYWKMCVYTNLKPVLLTSFLWVQMFLVRVQMIMLEMESSVTVSWLAFCQHTATSLYSTRWVRTTAEFIEGPLSFFLANCLVNITFSLN